MSPQIIIAKPCHQNWNKMTPEEQGRHCSVCSKVVKDFTKMEPEQIVQTLKNTKGEVCGRIPVKNLTPANKKQRLYFWINELVLRKAIYPLMALLGVGIFTKKAQAQVEHHYPLKGKVAIRDYYTNSKKITLIVKSNDKKEVIPFANITIISGIKNHTETLVTNDKGTAVVMVDAADVLSTEVEIKIVALGYEEKTMKIKLVKDIQTIEIRMEDEMMIMGEMMYVPEKTIETPTTEIMDSIPKIEVVKCTVQTIKELPQIQPGLYPLEDPAPVEVQEVIDINQIIDTNTNYSVNETTFHLFPNPSADFVTIACAGEQKFNVDIFDDNGKKMHGIVNINSRYMLDVSTYAAGAYYVLITMNGKAIETKKIIVSR